MGSGGDPRVCDPDFVLNPRDLRLILSDSLETRQVLLLSPHFLPSNLAGVHRVRLMSAQLRSFGWQPTIVTVDPTCYEEPSDATLMNLMPEGVLVERVGAWPARICRPLGIGDVSLRAQRALRDRVCTLIERLHPSLIFATVLPGYTSLIGAWAKRRFRIPFVLDYQDPWGTGLDSKKRWNKAWLANRIARFLEPGVLKQVDALTAVSDETLDSVRLRNLIPRGIPIESIPIGADENDHAVARLHGRSLISPGAGIFHIAYLGTITHRMLPALEAFLGALKRMDHKGKRILLHLLGTFEPDVVQAAERAGVRENVSVHPRRISYLDALRTMQDADLLLLIGSTDSHYTASKIFPYWLSEKPILGIFHRDSTIVPLSRELGGVHLALFGRSSGVEACIEQVTSALRRAVKGEKVVPPRVEAAFEPYSPRGVAERYARLFDAVAVRR